MRGSPYKELRHLCPLNRNHICPIIFTCLYSAHHIRYLYSQGICTCGSGNTYMRESSNEGQPIKRVAPQSFSSEYFSLVYFLYTIYGTSTVQGITELRHLCPLIAVFFPNNFHVFKLSTPFSVPLWYRVYVRVGVVIPVCGSPQMRGSP